MKPKGREIFTPAGSSARRFLALLFLLPLCALLTGCPHNDYTVELTPTAHGVERTLTFYRCDGGSSNAPNYQEFPSNELAAISHVYPANAVRQEGQRHIATAEFAGTLPADVGGVGSYTNYITSLGESGFYLERFRGEDDLAGKTLRQFHAADQLTDLILGWSKTEFGHARGYKNLRRFLDQDFRNDLKNAGQYFLIGAIGNLSDTNAAEEFTVRFCQYLYERGYVKLADVPNLPSIANDGDGSSVLQNLVQRLVAEKMGIPASAPLPQSLSILTNTATLEKSWTNYLAQTDLYRAKLNAWREKLKSDPQLEKPKPKPEDVANDLFANLLGISFDMGGDADHLTVKLSLKNAPDHSNGQWQDGRVVWDIDLPPDRPLPALCYANWNNPDETFQAAHFGGVLLAGDELTRYNLWRSALAPADGQAWDTFLSGLQPGSDLKQKIEAFQLTAKGGTNQLAAGRKLLVIALGESSRPNSK